jgi:hypothetical protein
MVEISQEELEDVMKKRVKREWDKLFVEKRPMPISYLTGYETGIRDVHWDLFGVKRGLHEKHKKFAEFIHDVGMGKLMKLKEVIE